MTANQLTAAITDRQKQLRALYRSENALRALHNLTRLENRLIAGSNKAEKQSHLRALFNLTWLLHPGQSKFEAAILKLELWVRLGLRFG